jgi:replicative DNA helicase
MTDTHDQLPPQDLHAEQATLGGCLVEPGAVDRVLGTQLKPADFYREAHRTIYQAILHVANEGRPVDIVTVSARLKSLGKLDDVGGGEYLSRGLIREAPTAAHVAGYAEIVIDRADLRAANSLAADIRASTERPGITGAEALGAAQERLDEIRSSRRTYAAGESLEEIVAWGGPRLLAEIERPSPVEGPRFGVESVDRVTGGLRPPCAALLMGDTSTGKTSALCQLALETARQGIGVGYIDLETSRYNIMRKVVQQACGVDMFRARTRLVDGDTKDAEMAATTDALEHIRGLPVHIEDPKRLTLPGLVALARQLHRERRPELLIIDYLQLLQCEPGANRYSALFEASKQLTALAHMLGNTTVFASQITVTEAGAFRVRSAPDAEHDADLTLTAMKLLPLNVGRDIDRREIPRLYKGSPRARIGVTKAREGITGVGELFWSDAWQRFFDYGEAGKHIDLGGYRREQFAPDEWGQLCEGARAARDEPPAPWVGG